MENQEDLIKLVFEALRVSKKVQLFERSEGVKYDESKAVILESPGAYNGFSVGDWCTREGEREGEIGEFGYLIAAFVKMTAKIEGVRGIKREKIFCVLAIPSPVEGGPSFDYSHHRILRATTLLSYGILVVAPDEPICLFRIERLQKIEQK